MLKVRITTIMILYSILGGVFYNSNQKTEITHESDSQASSGNATAQQIQPIQQKTKEFVSWSESDVRELFARPTLQSKEQQLELG